MSERHHSILLQLCARPVAADDYEIFEGEQRVGRVTFSSKRWYWHLYAEAGQHAREGSENAMALAALALRKALAASRRKQPLRGLSGNTESRFRSTSEDVGLYEASSGLRRVLRMAHTRVISSGKI
jgi:hypothetical protein